jgi:hypothetical protein
MLKPNAIVGAISLLSASVLSCHAATMAPAGIKSALDGERFGLFPAEHFQLSSGKCASCATLKQGLWYFQDDLVALPQPTQPMAGYSSDLQPRDEVHRWASSPGAKSLAYPSLVWLGAPQILESATIQPNGQQARMADGTLIDFQPVPKLATNRSYFNPSSVAFFGQREARMRGTLKQENGKSTFVARTIWPKDFIIAQDQLVAAPLTQAETLASFVRDAGGGATSPFSTRLIWERKPGQTRQWQDKPVIGVMLNGAQGDDDEAFGGHFAIATGRVGAHGEWADWTVNNFYNLDSFSEKGIVAATVPMDNYLMDLNSGQQYYRPSYMLVAILNNPRTAAAYQGGVQRIFNRFYRHDFTYQHAGANCAGISLDVFKALGWQIPERGPTGQFKAIGAYGYLAAKDGSLESGRKIYDYLTEEQIRLYPAVAFEAAGMDLLQLVGAAPGPARTLTEFEKQLQSDVEAVVLVRIPQVPSSRVAGSNPVFSFDEYMQRAPQDRSKWKIVPVDARPFPNELRDGAALVQAPDSGVPLPIMGICAGGVLGIGALIRRRRKRSVPPGQPASQGQDS